MRENEILVGTNNNTLGRTEIFSTTTPQNSILYGKSGPLSIVGTSCMITYLGDLPPDEYRRMLNNIFQATSAVPIVFPPYCFDGNEYSDGGVSFSSPLSSLLMIEKFNDILYVFPEDIELPNIIRSSTVIDAAQGYLSQVSRANYIQDRRSYLTTMNNGDCSRLKLLKGILETFTGDLQKDKALSPFR